MQHAGSASENVEVVIVGPDIEPSVRRAIPLVEHFLDAVFVPVNAKNDRPLLALVTGIAVDLQFHTAQQL